ncbi:hypothetical protein NDU88_007083 [Pleurodeles waltl]|uniref:Uncharacterized protein n=1 Tax=Pleurodeles waltl TaxID=8319 RepID=A0AAV7VTE9_PLEWA|nr:hypothetical protein NDU88_007083 [Pleurodeles waltl]
MAAPYLAPNRVPPNLSIIRRYSCPVHLLQLRRRDVTLHVHFFRLRGRDTTDSGSHGRGDHVSLRSPWHWVPLDPPTHSAVRRNQGMILGREGASEERPIAKHSPGTRSSDWAKTRPGIESARGSCLTELPLPDTVLHPGP